MIFHEDWWYISRLSKMSAGIIRQTIHIVLILEQHILFIIHHMNAKMHESSSPAFPSVRWHLTRDVCCWGSNSSTDVSEDRRVRGLCRRLRLSWGVGPGCWVTRGVLAEDCSSWAERPRIAEHWADTDTGTQTSIRDRHPGLKYHHLAW